MLGRLARWLRILGLDTWYFRQMHDRDLVAAHRQSGRVLLTRDTGLLRIKGLGPHLEIRFDRWDAQLRQVLDAYSLPVEGERLFSRCLQCNRPLRDLTLREVQGKVPDFVFSSHQRYRGCTCCGKIFWQGSHRRRVLQVLAEFCPQVGVPVESRIRDDSCARTGFPENRPK